MDDPMMHAYPPMYIVDWLKERRENCLFHASHKTGKDRLGWLEDAEYFKMAIDAINLKWSDRMIVKMAPTRIIDLQQEVERLKNAIKSSGTSAKD